MAKKTTLQVRINDAWEELFPKTSSEQIIFPDGSKSLQSIIDEVIADTTDICTNTSNHVKVLQNELTTIAAVAKGALKGISFDNYTDVYNYLMSAPRDELTVGQHIYVRTLNVPDLWVSAIREWQNTPVLTDEQFVNALLKGELTIGHYTLNALEGNKVISEPAGNLKNGPSEGAVQQVPDGAAANGIQCKIEAAKEFNAALNNLQPYGGIGLYSTALGGKSSAQGKRSFASGTNTIALGNYSHAEGDNSITLGADSHAEGYSNLSYGTGSHSEGRDALVLAAYSHGEGGGNTIYQEALYAHGEGFGNEVKGYAAHAEGNCTKATANYSHTEGTNTVALAPASHAEGFYTEVGEHGDASHAEGASTQANGASSHAEGASTVANGASSHAEGAHTYAIGENSHAEGCETNAVGDHSHAGGLKSTAAGYASFAHGIGLEALGVAQAVFGQHNVEDADSVLIVGTGTELNRRTAFKVTIDGKVKSYTAPVDGEDIVRLYELTRVKEACVQKLPTVTSEVILTQKPDGSTDRLAFSADTNAHYLVRRDSNGQVIVPLTPNSSASATSRDYVDKAVANAGGGGGGSGGLYKHIFYWENEYSDSWELILFTTRSTKYNLQQDDVETWRQMISEVVASKIFLDMWYDEYYIVNGLYPTEEETEDYEYTAGLDIYYYSSTGHKSLFVTDIMGQPYFQYSIQKA